MHVNQITGLRLGVSLIIIQGFIDNCFSFENGSLAKTVYLLNISGITFSARAVFCCLFCL